MTPWKAFCASSAVIGLCGLHACVPGAPADTPHAAASFTEADLDLSTPEARNRAMVKIVGSIGNEEIHAFMRFHVYGYPGDGNVIPFFSMNNYIVQRWTPVDGDSYELNHYEVGYYTKFDTDEPIDFWTNELTGEVVELEPFILGPITRLYTPDGIQSPGIAPNPLRINVIGDHVFVPAQSIESFPNLFSPEEWPELSTGPLIYWDSMYTFSARLDQVADPTRTSTDTEIHMQNLVSWQPFLKLGQRPGRTMVRAWGASIAGPQDLPPAVRSDFEAYTPQIFNTDDWTEIRFDSFDYYNKMVAERAANAAGE